MPVECLHGGRSFLRDVGATEDFAYGCEYDVHIGLERHMVDVPHVKLELLGPGDGVAAVTLRLSFFPILAS